MTQTLFSYIQHSPTPFHAVAETAARLEAKGATRLNEAQSWSLESGKRYFTVRGGTSLIAWRQPTGKGLGWRMTAAHSDSPSFRIKSASVRQGCTMLNTEGYGGALRSTWMDRPLGIAGRVSIATPDGIVTRLVDMGGRCAVMPSLAIHMDRKANDGHTFDPKKDTQALFGLGSDETCYLTALANCAGCKPQDILGSDMQLYCSESPGLAGDGDALVLSPRLDDLACAWAALDGFLAAPAHDWGDVFCLFDNEEVGSTTAQGACSTLLADVLARAGAALDETAEDHRIALAKSLLLSADNGHATHPNFSELADATHPVRLGSGIVLKMNANQKYTTTGLSGGLVAALCKKAGVPVQLYYNRPDMPGGSTLGNLLTSGVSVPMADIGLPQLAMHSCVETAAKQDVLFLQQTMQAWYTAAIKTDTGCDYTLGL